MVKCYCTEVVIMYSFSFLSSNQITGFGQLDILKEFGTKCNMTDFSILLVRLNTSSNIVKLLVYKSLFNIMI